MSHDRPGWTFPELVEEGPRIEAKGLGHPLLLAPVRNDVGLLSEEYDPRAQRQLGNFPQAITHVALINTARNVSSRGGPCEHRSGGMRKCKFAARLSIVSHSLF